jgi:HAE1 family hydrophobic/amphiphilic exporter-1
MTREEILSGNQAIFIFLICLIFVYLLLAAQYESFLLPLPVILSLPTGIFGAFFFLKITGLDNNIYAQVALVMLIGLLGKNAILIVEFAIQRQKDGISILQAAAEGARSRLRPILMTSLAFIAGLIPLCIADGAGAIGNRSIGTAAAGGMLFGTIFGLILIPGLYVIFAGMGAAGKKTRDPQPHQPSQFPLSSIPVVLLIMVTVFVTGCSQYKSAMVTAPANGNLPATFDAGNDSAHADTTNIASLPIGQFFPDPYLRQLIDTALAANPDILAALQKVEIAGANLKYSRSWLLPSVNFEATAGLRKYSDYTMDGVGNFDTNLSPDISKDQHIPDPTPDYFLGFRSSWELDLWGRLHARKNAAFTRFLASREGYRMVITSLTAQIATLYYQLLALDNEQAILRKNIQLQENALEIVKVQKLGGRATELAVQQFQAQLLHTRSLRHTTAQQITETESQLNFLQGSFSRPILRDSSIAALPVPASLTAGVPSQLLLNRPDIREAEAGLTAMNADIRAARAAFFPTVNLSGFLGYNAFATALLFNAGSVVYGLAGGLTAPVFNRKAIRADYERSIAEGRLALYNYQKTILTGFQEVTNSLKGMVNYDEFYRLKQDEVNSLNNAVSVANDLYLVGRASYLEVITAQRNVLDAELEMTNAKKNIFLNAVNLYRAVGGGWR